MELTLNYLKKPQLSDSNGYALVFYCPATRSWFWRPNAETSRSGPLDTFEDAMTAYITATGSSED